MIVSAYGGVYADLDFELLHPLGELAAGVPVCPCFKQPVQRPPWPHTLPTRLHADDLLAQVLTSVSSKWGQGGQHFGE